MDGKELSGKDLTRVGEVFEGSFVCLSYILNSYHTSNINLWLLPILLIWLNYQELERNRHVLLQRQLLLRVRPADLRRDDAGGVPRQPSTGTYPLWR